MGLLNESQAAKYLAVSPRTLQAWRFYGRGPRYLKISSRCVRYRREDLDAFVTAYLSPDPAQDPEINALPDGAASVIAAPAPAPEAMELRIIQGELGTSEFAHALGCSDTLLWQIYTAGKRPSARLMMKARDL